ncbi:hypothetical protein BDW66DRAFT_167434 [Aspergillus desertorum]
MSSYIHQTLSTNKDTEYMAANGSPDLKHNSPQHALASARMENLQNPVAGGRPADSRLKPEIGAGAGTGESLENQEVEHREYSSAADNVMKAEGKGRLGDTGGLHYLEL